MTGRAVARDKFARFLRDAELSAGLKKQYQAAADRVMAGMGPKALEAWSRNLAGIKFYASAAAAHAAAKSDRPGQHAAFARRVGDKVELHLNGGSENDSKAPRSTAAYYAHEFAHVVDADHYSTRPQWSTAWKKEGREYAESIGKPDSATDHQEGFADFAAAAWTYPKMAENHFPACSAAWHDWGLF